MSDDDKKKPREETRDPSASSDAPIAATEDEGEDRMRSLIKSAMKSSRSEASTRRAKGSDVAILTKEESGGDGGGDGDGDAGNHDGDDDPPSSGIVDEVDLRDALRGALRPPPGTVAPDLLQGVQRKLRVRSRGKFYGDGWSTAESPKSTYLITTIIMLILVALVFLVLIPWSSATLP